MKVLAEDWRFKVVFDNLLLKDLKNFSFSLTEKERFVFDKQVDAFKSFFCLNQVIEQLVHIKTPEQFVALQKNVTENIGKLLHCPKQLYTQYMGKIKNVEADFRPFLIEVLQYATEAKPFNPNAIYKLLLGSLFGTVKKVCNGYAKRKNFKHQQTKLVHTDISFKLKNQSQELSRNFNLQGVWGKFNNIDYKTFINPDFGWGKWKTSKFSSFQDTFIVNTNSQTLTDKELEFSFHMNVYPGMAHFYHNILSEDFTNNFDNGAHFVVNGWNTFAAWHIKPNAFTRNDKITKSKMIKFLFNKPSVKNLNNLYLYLLSAYDQNSAIRIFYILTQYPTMFESYVLGAFATELLIDHGFCLGPFDYLRQLKKYNVGDFFGLYKLSIKNKKGGN